MLCVTRRNSIANGPTVHPLARLAPASSRSRRVDAVLLELRLDQRQRQRRAVDRAVEERQHVRHARRCDPRGRASAPAPRPCRCCRYVRSGMIRSTPSSSGSGNMTPASTTIVVSPQATRHHVHAELAEAAERDQIQRREIGCCSRIVSHQFKAPHIAGYDTLPDSDNVGCSDRPFHQSKDTTRKESRPGGRSLRVLRRRAATRVSTWRRWDGRPGTAQNCANYSTAYREAVAKNSASRASSVSCSVSGRRDRSIPALVRASRTSRARPTA